MHPLNRYALKKPDFNVLAAKHSCFAPFVTHSESGFASIDFQNPQALRSLTAVLLKEDWDLDVELRDDRLCPTLANRLDYLLHVLDLEQFLHPVPSEGPPNASRTSVLDIGTGHVAIYPLLLHRLRPLSKVLATEESVQLIKAPLAGEILFPLRDYKVDLVICNPPFFASVEEMRQGQDIKAGPAHAAPTAALNELVTRGGEVAFVGQMITESLGLCDRCKWFTSLIGKYSSLQPLVDQLRKSKIDNYFVKSLRQSRTTRWILGWSYTPLRLPDTYTRPEPIISGTSFAKLLPTSNTLSHTPLHPPFPLSQLRQAVLAVLKSVQLSPGSAYSVAQDDGTILLSPRIVTWSRAARRQAARETAGDGLGAAAYQNYAPAESPLFVARLAFKPHSTDREVPPLQLSAQAHAPPTGATVTLDFVWGRDRNQIDAFWKFILTKANLVGSQDVQAAPRHQETGPAPQAKRARVRGRGGL